MIPAQPGTLAEFKNAHGDRYLKPVVAWDDDGNALVDNTHGYLRSVQSFSSFIGTQTVGGDADSRRPVQLIPGDGWQVTYTQDGYTGTEPLVAWALCADGEVRPVIGENVGTPEVLDDSTNDLCFTVRTPAESEEASA